MNRLTNTLYAIASVALLGLGACSDTAVSPPDDNGIQVPTTYSFTSRFDASTSSVSYEGQIVRQLLIQDLASVISGLTRPGATAVTEADLLALYEHSDAANLMTLTSISGREVLEARYNRISTGKKLSDKISTDAVIGMNGNADQLVRGWLATVASNSQDPAKLGTRAVLFDENGLDLGEMIGKVLLGAVAYSQGTSTYLANILTKDNATAADDGNGGKLPFTTMEHNWDEAFGYFGAARDFARYTDAQLAGSATEYSYDANNDGKIDLRSEYNYTFARYAGRRDKAGVGTDFTKDIFDGFLAGRTAIANQGTTTEIAAQRSKILSAWEKVIAASVVHYINGVKSSMADIGKPEQDLDGLRHEWSEMKAYTITLQFNTAKAISDAQLVQLHDLMGSAPVTIDPATEEHTQYLAKLDAAKNIIKSAYGFSDAQMSAW